MARRDFIEQYAEGEFDAATVSNMQDAFGDAWLRMQKSKAPYCAPEYETAGRTILATTLSGRLKRGSAIPGGWLTTPYSIYRNRN
jgi:hypothetical protein